MKEEFILKFYEDRSIRVEFKEDKDTKTKVIDVDTLLDCIRKSLLTEEVRSGLLPENVLSVNIDSKTNVRYVVVEFPLDRTDITYMETVYTDFPIPRIVFGFKLEGNGRIDKINMGVIGLGKLKPDMPMYFYPFSNVNFFQLCVGVNELPHIESLHQLSGLPYYILSMPDNDDYFKTGNNRLKANHRDLLEHLKDKDRQYYYDNILVTMPSKTLKDFIDGG